MSSIIKIPIKSDKGRIGVFDMGKVNYAYYIEEFSIAVLKKLREEYKKLPKNLQRKVKGKMNKNISSILNKIYKSAKRIEQDVIDIRGDKNSKKLDVPTRRNLLKLLESKRALWQSCDFIVIEKQFFNKKSANIDAIKLQEITLIWFLEHFPDKMVIEFNACFKTYVLGGPKMTKPQRKKWAIMKGNDIYKMRGDSAGLEQLKIKKTATGKVQKLDDVFDCVLMSQAFKYLFFITV